MDEILKKYRLISNEREIVAFIGRRKAIWAVLQEIHPHIVRAYGNRVVHLRVNWKDNKIEILIDVAFPPQQLNECFAKLSNSYYDSVPNKLRDYFIIDKIDYR